MVSVGGPDKAAKGTRLTSASSLTAAMVSSLMWTGKGCPWVVSESATPIIGDGCLPSCEFCPCLLTNLIIA